jgi:hypothetical protein
MRIWKEALVVLIKTLFCHQIGGTEEEHEKPVRIAGAFAERFQKST